MRTIKWTCGITTVPERVGTLLPRAIKSLRNAGFKHPHIFGDGFAEPPILRGLSWVCRYPDIPRCNFGNWMLGAWELYLREPNADRYAMFEDDIVCVKNLRSYLDSCHYPNGSFGWIRGYWNLFTYPHNIANNPGKAAWFPSDQMGKGALALVFDNDTLKTLLSSSHMVHAVQAINRGQRALDGAIARAMSANQVTEFVHNPSLVQHTGFGNSVLRPQNNKLPPEKQLPQADTFPGEDFDATEFPKLWRQRREVVHLADAECELRKVETADG